ncbi:MAG: FtsX-like permease family protein [Candidatus Dormibacteraeota bacterium]|nr:FtsX-like permease family protein [Candidatus Dormibacteraeota bacterium]
MTAAWPAVDMENLPGLGLLLSYALRDLLRNPRRTLASLSGVALAVGLFASITFFVDFSAARMTERAIAPVAIDMQAGLSSPLASPLALTETLDLASLAPGRAVTVSLAALNNSARPMTGVVVSDQPPPQLAYVPGSTALDGKPVADVAGESPLAQGLRLANLMAGARVAITYRAQATAPVASTSALSLAGTIRSAEEPAPSAANSPQSPTLGQLAAATGKLPGVTRTDPLGSVDLPAGSLRSNTQTIAQPLRVFAFDPGYVRHYPIVRLTAGGYGPGTVLLSPDAARGLAAVPGGTVSLALPGRALPLALTVGGTADFTRADPLFASRSAANQGEFVQVPNVLVVPISVFETAILPALRLDAASASPILKTPPALEVDVHIDRARLASDPTLAVVSTQGLKRSIERIAPGQVAVIDNLSDSLNAAKGDTILAKILFLFLGLPGVLLAAYLSRYAGGLLAHAQRREQATLRARGAQPRHLLSALTYTTAGVAVVGSVVGLGLGLLTVVLVLGRSVLAQTSPQSLGLSAGLSLLAGLTTTALALYLPGRRALAREAGEERRELALSAPPAWLRLRLDLVFLAAAALVWIVTMVSGGFKPTAAEGQSVSLSFYTLLSPLLGWLGATLLAVRLLLAAGGRLAQRRGQAFGGLTAGTLRRSVQRRPLALASGVIAVALAVAFGSSLALFVSTYDVQKQADARFVTGSDVRVTPSALSTSTAAFDARLKVPGVAGVTPLAQTSSAVVGTDKRALVALDAATFPKVATLPDAFFSHTSAAAAMAALRSDPAAVLVSVEMARTFNVQPGDQVKIQLPDQSGRLVPVTFHAAAIFQNFAGFPQGIDLVSNLDYYQTATGSPRVDLFFVRTSDPSPASVTHVASLLRSGPGQTTPLLVETTATAVNRDASTLAAINLRGLGGLESVYAVLMSVAGIALFVFGLLLQRRKEYVTMRALGIRMGQLRGLVLGEATVVAVLGLGVGAAVGAAMGVMFVQILAPLFTIPPTSLAVPALRLGVLSSLVLGGTGLSVLLAARSLRRLNPVELLREE